MTKSSRLTRSPRAQAPRALPQTGSTSRPAPSAVEGPIEASDIDDTFYRHIVAGMRNGVLAITRASALALINDDACKIFGLERRSSDLGQPVATVLKDHPDVVRVLSGVFDLHHLPNRVEMRLKPSGKVIGYTLAHVRDDRGNVVGAAMFFKDLTRVEQLEERERLRDRLAAVGQLAAVFAHEVKNPLAGIEVMAGLLRRKVPDSADAQKVLTDIIAEAKMANAIVQEVLDFVRPIRLEVEHTAIADAIHGAIHLADTKARRGGVQVKVNLPAELPRIQGDQHQLTQLFTNLLINAYEAMNGEGRVIISAEMARLEDGADGREAIVVDCADDGPGMPSEVAEKIFDPFFTTKPQGSGLGLAIVRKIVDAHDGRIDIRTAAQRGTTIRVTLPVTADDGAH